MPLFLPTNYGVKTLVFQEIYNYKKTTITDNITTIQNPTTSATFPLSTSI